MQIQMSEDAGARKKAGERSSVEFFGIRQKAEREKGVQKQSAQARACELHKAPREPPKPKPEL
jgi:hypothetical protein